MILELPQVFKNSKIMDALEVELKERRAVGKIATLFTAPEDSFRSMAMANYSRWVLNGKDK